MAWIYNDSPDRRSETAKCRTRLLRYCTGAGLDLGCGKDKIRPEAIGVDRDGTADINCDIGKGLNIFAKEGFDYVFSSHCLEDLEHTEAVLEEWWSKVRVGGHLVLYLPHKDFYPNIGADGANVEHKHDFTPGDIISVMDRLGSYSLVRNEDHNEADEYSFELVFRKVASEKVKMQVITGNGDSRPKALVIRYGAYGDHLIASPMVKRLHEAGYHITYNCTSRAFPVIANNPYIDTTLEQIDHLIPNTSLDEYWADLGNGFDKVINLSETIEVKFLYAPDHAQYNDPVEKRREDCGQTNYYDYALEVAGFNDVFSPRPELYPTKMEEAMGRYFREKYHGKFLILWALAGSSMHKTYPWAEQVALEFLQRHQDAMTLTTGDDLSRLIEWNHERALKMAGVWDIRSAMLATKYVDLVISPETGILNAAGCFTTPKIGFLTHSNKTNLTKYFANDFSIQADIECAPCHRMIYGHNAAKDCPRLDLGEGAWLCACCGAFDPNVILKRMEFIYAAWKEKNRKVSLIRPEQAVRDWNRLKLREVVQPGRVAVQHRATP